VFRTFTHNFGNNYPIFQEIQETMLPDLAFKTNITAEPGATMDSIVREISIASMQPFKNGKMPLPFLMAKTDNMPPDLQTTVSATFCAETIAVAIF
jgi:hypothetical protein